MLITSKLGSHINNDGILKIVSQEDRSQLGNKKHTIQKFYTLLERAFAKEKKRKATKPSKQSKKKRLKLKRIHSEKKQLRSEWKKEVSK